MKRGIEELDTLLECITRDKKKQFDEQAYLVGSAFEGKPIQEKALVFVFEGKEYLVPFENAWDGTCVTESTVRLDKVERIIARPKATSCMSEMMRTRKIPKKAQAALVNGVNAWFFPERGYKVKVVPFDAAQEKERA